MREVVRADDRDARPHAVVVQVDRAGATRRAQDHQPPLLAQQAGLPSHQRRVARHLEDHVHHPTARHLAHELADVADDRVDALKARVIGQVGQPGRRDVHHHDRGGARQQADPRRELPQQPRAEHHHRLTPREAAAPNTVHHDLGDRDVDRSTTMVRGGHRVFPRWRTARAVATWGMTGRESRSHHRNSTKVAIPKRNST